MSDDAFSTYVGFATIPSSENIHQLCHGHLLFYYLEHGGTKKTLLFSTFEAINLATDPPPFRIRVKNYFYSRFDLDLSLTMRGLDQQSDGIHERLFLLIAISILMSPLM